MQQDTRTALLDSAERAVRTRGFDGFSYADLANDVGIRKASIHHHFPTKAALSVALMKRYHEEFSLALAKIDATSSSANLRLAAVIEHYKTALHGGKTLCLCVSLSTSLESLPPEVSIQISQFRAMIIEWLAKVFEDGAKQDTIRSVQNPSAEATAMLPLLEGAQLAARAQQDSGIFDAAVQLLKLRLAGP